LVSVTEEIDLVRKRANKVLSTLKPIRETSGHHFVSRRSEAGRSLPSYASVYFLFVDLLGFDNWGREEKVSWTVPIEYKGESFLISHRKMGLGLFCSEDQESSAREIVSLVTKAVRAAEPYYKWRAEQAIQESHLNVSNRCSELFGRYSYHLDRYREEVDEAEAKAKGKVEAREANLDGAKELSLAGLNALLLEEMLPDPSTEVLRWSAIATVEAFYSWTEHLFIHIAILLGKAKSGPAVVGLIDAEWKQKFKTVFDISDPESKRYYDELLELRREVRNFAAHGAFGKNGEAFDFHSGAGAVPIQLRVNNGKSTFTVENSYEIEDAKAVELTTSFVEYLWAGSLAPAKIYLEEASLPTVLTYGEDGTYDAAMQSAEDMSELVGHIVEQADRAANMDW